MERTNWDVVVIGAIPAGRSAVLMAVGIWNVLLDDGDLNSKRSVILATGTQHPIETAV